MNPQPRSWFAAWISVPCLLLLASSALFSVQSQEDPPKSISKLREIAQTSPRQALLAAHKSGLEGEQLKQLEAEFGKMLEKHVQTALGKPTPVKYDPVITGFDSLDEREKIEQLRDWALLAAYAQMDPEPLHAQLALGTRAALRREHRAGLSQYSYGPGRIAALDQGEYLVLVPATQEAGKESFDWRTATRLLDERRSVDGEVPETVRICTYQLGKQKSSNSIAIRYVGKMLGSDFQTAKFGFASATVKNLKDLGKALTQFDDLLSVEFNGNVVELEGRKYPPQGNGLARKHIDLMDLKVVFESIGLDAKGKLVSFAFSIDPWIDGKTLAIWLDRVKTDYMQSGALKAIGKEVFSQKANIDPQDPKVTVVGGPSNQRQLASKTIPVNLIEGKQYKILLASKIVDSLVLVQDEKGKQLALGRPVGSNDSVVFFVPPKTGTYNVVAASQFGVGEVSLQITEGDGKNDKEIATLGEIIQRIGKQGIFVAPSKQRKDTTGLFEFIDSLKQAQGNKREALLGLAKRLEEEVKLNQFHVPRYEGRIAGTDVGMTLFYTDLVAKLFAMDSIRVDAFGSPPLGALQFSPERLAKVKLPHGDGFTFLPLTEVRFAAHHLADVRKFHQGRLWFAPKRSGFVVIDDGKGAQGVQTIRFAPVATSLFMKSRDGQVAEETDANVHYESYTRFWNNYYTSIAEAEPEYARLNELMKWSAVLLMAERHAKTPFEDLFKEPQPPKDLLFKSWYAAAGKNQRIGVTVPLPFRTQQERHNGEAVDSLRPVLSRSYQIGGHEGFQFTESLSGGVTGSGEKDVQARQVQGKVPFGLPSDILPEADKAGGWKNKPILRPDASSITLSPADKTSAVESAPGRRYITTRTLDIVAANKPVHEMTTRLVPDKSGRWPLVIQDNLKVGQILESNGQLKVSKAGPAGIEVQVVPGAMDCLPLILDRIASGRQVDPKLVEEIRSDPENERLFIRAAVDHKPWIEIKFNEKNPGDSFRYGRPGESVTFQATIVDQAIVKLPEIRVTAPPFVRVAPHDGQVKIQPSWVQPGGKISLPVEFGGGKTELRLAPAPDIAPQINSIPFVIPPKSVRDLYVEAKVADLFLGVETQDIYRLYDVIAPLEKGDRFVETSLLNGKVHLQQMKNGWVLTRGPAPDSILAGNKGKPSSVIQAVVVRDSKPRSVKVELDGFAFPSKGKIVLPPEPTKQEMETARAVVERLNAKPNLLEAVRRLNAITTKQLEEVDRRHEMLQNAPVATVATAGRDLEIRIPGNEGPFNLGDALQAANAEQPLPKAWSQLGNRTIRLQVATLSPQESQTLAESFRVLQPQLERQGTTFILDLGLDGAARRTGNLLNWDRASFLNDEQSLQQVQRVGPMVLNLLNALPPSSPPGALPPSTPIGGLPHSSPPGVRNLRFVVGHLENDTAFIERQLEQVRRGDYYGQNVILLVCTENREPILRFASQALRSGTNSFVLPTRTIDVRTAPLALFELSRNPNLHSGNISSDVIRQAYRQAATTLRGCRNAANPRQAIIEEYGEKFGSKLQKLFTEFNQAEFDALIEALERDAAGFQQVVDIHPVRPFRRGDDFRDSSGDRLAA